jgi:septum formation protein
MTAPANAASPSPRGPQGVQFPVDSFAKANKLYLASASPRRLELLKLAGFNPEILTLDVPEVQLTDEAPSDYGRRVATAKAVAGMAALGQAEHVLVLGADTEVVLDGRVFGKPDSSEAAAEMLARLSGRTHEVITAVAICTATQSECFIHSSAVRFKTLQPRDIAAYISTGEPFGKAGAYAIQGAAATFIDHLQGSFSSVMGLPIFETNALLNRFGVFATWQTPA